VEDGVTAKAADEEDEGEVKKKKKLACLTEVLSSSPSTRDICTMTNLSQNISARVTESAVPSGGGRCHGKSS
jgi:hypothetical protein